MSKSELEQQRSALQVAPLSTESTAVPVCSRENSIPMRNESIIAQLHGALSSCRLEGNLSLWTQTDTGKITIALLAQDFLGGTILQVSGAARWLNQVDEKLFDLSESVQPLDVPLSLEAVSRSELLCSEETASSYQFLKAEVLDRFSRSKKREPAYAEGRTHTPLRK